MCGRCVVECVNNCVCVCVFVCVCVSCIALTPHKHLVQYANHIYDLKECIVDKGRKAKAGYNGIAIAKL